MPVPSAITDLSTTASSNSPAGSEAPTTADDYLRTHASFIAKLYAEKLDRAGTVTATANQPMGTYKHTGAGTATAAGEYVVWNQTGVKFPAIGIGVSSSAWGGTGVYAIDMGARGSLATDTNSMSVGANVYYDGTNFRAKETAAAALLSVQSGNVSIQTASSVSAGAVQTFVEKLRIDSAGIEPSVPSSYTATSAGLGSMRFDLLSDTSLRIRVRGYDGAERSVTLTLA